MSPGQPLDLYQQVARLNEVASGNQDSMAPVIPGLTGLARRIARQRYPPDNG